jgi:steroid 5-alpha reductase family enzyme
LSASILTFAVSTLSKNYSQVDKLWSIIPIVYAWIPVCDVRTTIMAMVVSVWGVRLTWNFHRRGGYHWPPWQGEEDYRWAEIHNGRFVRILRNPVVWLLFNLGFISFYQNLLLLFITWPSYAAYTAFKTCSSDSQGITFLDIFAVILGLCFVAIESVADNQQYAFQTEKNRRKNAGEVLSGEYLDGFKQSGLYGIVRKPNYAAEQSFWISFYIFSVTASGRWINSSAVGWILLVGLFQGSGWFTEKLTRSKYSKYAEYMKRVPLYVPNAMLPQTAELFTKKHS